MSFTFILFLSVISIFVSTFYMSVNSLKIYFCGDCYSAKIINYKTYKEREESNDGRYRFKTLHISIVKFDDKFGNKKVLESVTHTGSIPEIGKTIKVSYLEGSKTVLEQNFKTFFLLFIGLIFSIIFGFLSMALITYAFGYTTKGYKDFFLKAFLKGFHISLALFAILLLYPIYSFIIGDSSLPFWTIGICLVISLMVVYILFFVLKVFRKKIE